MRYIVRASKTHEYDRTSGSFGNIVYDGPDFRVAKAKMREYADYGGVAFESREE